MVGVLAAAAAAAIAFVVITGALESDDEQTAVQVHRGDAPAALDAVNRGDEYGADTMRAYLQSALACTAVGQMRMRVLSQPVGRPVAKRLASLCLAPERSAVTTVKATVAQENLDFHNRSLWRIQAAGAADELMVRMSQGDDGWLMDSPCLPKHCEGEATG